MVSRKDFSPTHWGFFFLSFFFLKKFKSKTHTHKHKEAKGPNKALTYKVNFYRSAFLPVLRLRKNYTGPVGFADVPERRLRLRARDTKWLQKFCPCEGWFSPPFSFLFVCLCPLPYAVYLNSLPLFSPHWCVINRRLPLGCGAGTCLSRFIRSSPQTAPWLGRRCLASPSSRGTGRPWRRPRTVTCRKAPGNAATVATPNLCVSSCGCLPSLGFKPKRRRGTPRSAERP